MTDSLEKRGKRFRKKVAQHAQKQVVRKTSNLYVDTCIKLAPLFDHDPHEIRRIWYDCLQHEEDAAEAFRAEMKDRGMHVIGVFVHPQEGKVGKKKEDSLFSLITDVRNTMVWKQFVDKLREVQEPVIMVFKPLSRRPSWVMTNREYAAAGAGFSGRIIIPIEGEDAPDVCIMPLQEYMEEIL